MGRATLKLLIAAGFAAAVMRSPAYADTAPAADGQGAVVTQYSDGNTPPKPVTVSPAHPFPVTTVDGAPYTFTPVGSCAQITSLGTAAGFSSPPAAAIRALITIEGQPVRMTDAGPAPSATVGLLLPVGGPWPYQGAIASVQFIQTAASAKIDVCYYK